MKRGERGSNYQLMMIKYNLRSVIVALNVPFAPITSSQQTLITLNIRVRRIKQSLVYKHSVFSLC